MAFELRASRNFLVAAKPAYLELCENENLFKIPMRLKRENSSAP